MISIIGDIAGRYDELMELVSSLPPGKIICVGDIIDRGPESKKVVEWAIENQDRVTCLYGNHEDMMLKAYKFHQKGGLESFSDPVVSWFWNGGTETLDSYGGFENIPPSHIEWMSGLRRFYEDEELIVSHAPIPFQGPIELQVSALAFIWNRNRPAKREKFQVFGHNSRLEWFGDYAVCIDSSSDRQLSAITFPEKTILSVPYNKAESKP